VKEFFLGYDDDPIERFTSWTYFLDEPTKSRLLAKRGERAASAASRLLHDLDRDSALDDRDARMLAVDVGSFLDANLLEYTDRASMAVGLEVRVPLLDHRFVETSLNLPFSYKLRGRRTKAVFRDAFAEMVAPEQAKLPKRGFNVPLAIYMKELDAYFDAPPRVRDRFGDRVGATWKSGVLDRKTIDALRADHRAGRADTSSELFAIMMFDRWWAEYVDGATVIDQSDDACAS
jgi:asparagine synthase (glutamine-hydrolysing)